MSNFLDDILKNLGKAGQNTSKFIGDTANNINKYGNAVTSAPAINARGSVGKTSADPFVNAGLRTSQGLQNMFRALNSNGISKTVVGIPQGAVTGLGSLAQTVTHGNDSLGANTNNYVSINNPILQQALDTKQIGDFRNEGRNFTNGIPSQLGGLKDALNNPLAQNLLGATGAVLNLSPVTGKEGELIAKGAKAGANVAKKGAQTAVQAVDDATRASADKVVDRVAGSLGQPANYNHSYFDPNLVKSAAPDVVNKAQKYYDQMRKGKDLGRITTSTNEKGFIEPTTKDGLARYIAQKAAHDQQPVKLDGDLSPKLYAQVPTNHIEAGDLQAGLSQYKNRAESGAVPAGMFDPTGTLGKEAAPSLGATPQQVAQEPENALSRFSNRLMEEDRTAPINSTLLQNSAHEVLRNKDVLAKTSADIAANEDKALALAKRGSSSEANATALQLTDKYLKEGSYEKATDLLTTVLPRFTRQGQETQILAAYSKLTPTGAVKFAQHTLDKASSRNINQGHIDSTTTEVFNTVKKQADEVASQIQDEIKAGTLGDTAITQRKLARATKSTAPSAKKPTTLTPKTPEQMLADRINASSERTLNKPDPVKDMVNTLHKVAKEVLPEAEKSVPRDPMQLIGKAIRDKAKYGDIYDKAKAIVFEKYKNDPRALTELDKYFGTEATRTYAKNQLNRGVQQELKGVDLGKIVKQHFSKVDETGSELKQKLIDRAGLSNAEATQLSGDIQKRYKELVQQRKDSILKQMFGERPKTEQVGAVDKILQMSNLGALSKDELRPLVAKKLGIPSLTKENTAKITELANQIQALPEGRERLLKTAEMMGYIQKLVPVGWVKKVSSLQTMGQLLNPKTAIRNIGGNVIFGAGAENVSQVGAAGLDKLVSKIRGSARTTTLPNLKVQARAAVQGGKDAFEETRLGISLGPDTQFDLSSVPTFDSKFFGGLEKTLGITLKVPDRAAYKAAYEDTLHGLMKANKSDTATDQMLELAHANGMYRTFQDDSVPAQLFSKLKEALNHVGVEKNGARFGLGDLILKYPKTPGNIIARGLDYSPVGIAKALYQIVRPAIIKEPFDQHTFVNSFSRGAVGTSGLIGAGTVLGALGIITEAPNQDTDTRNLQKSAGQGGYQINVDGLKRFFLSGFNKDAAKLQKGDNLVSYDWAQPLSIPLSAGAALGKQQNPGEAAVSSVENLSSGLNTLVEQPLVTGVNTFASNIKNYGVIGALGKTAQGLPASFVPTASNQARQLTDNTTRSTYDPNPYQQTLNMALNKIPGAAGSLPAQVDTLGNDKQNYQNGSNNILNVLFNPSTVNQYKPNSAADTALGIYSRSGNTNQIPTTTKPTQTINGKELKLSSQQNHDFQEYVGDQTNRMYNLLKDNQSFQSLSDSDKAKNISSKLSDINAAAKIAVLGDNPSKVSSSVKGIVEGSTATISGKTTGASASLTVAPTLDAQSKSTLTQYSNLSTADRDKKFYSDPAAEYQYDLAKYKNDAASGNLTKTQDIKKQTDLAKEQVGAGFSKDVRDLYSLSSSQLYGYVSQDPNGKAIVNQVLAYGDALQKSGVADNKFRSKNGSVTIKPSGSSSGSGGRKASSVKNASNTATLSAFKTAKNVKLRKVTGKSTKAKSLLSYKKPAKAKEFKA